MKTYKLNFTTDYYQFYILDSQTKATTDADDFWNDEANERRLAIGEGLLGVTIGTFGKVNAEIRLLDKKSVENPNANHCVEASIKLVSNKLQFKNCSNYETQLEIELEKENYRIRIASFGLETISGEDGNDYYEIEIWKSKLAKPKLLKKHT